MQKMKNKREEKLKLFINYMLRNCTKTHILHIRGPHTTNLLISSRLILGMKIYAFMH